VSVTVTLTGGGPSALGRFKWQAAAVRWADTVGPIGRTALRARAPRGKGQRAGRFAMSIRYARRSTGGLSVEVRYTANTPYARYVIEPTRPHKITAKAARRLHFVDAQGKDHFPVSVNHPGTKGNDFHLRTMRAYVPVAQGAYTRIMRESLGGL
jgi:hypothetical protein